MSRRKLLTMKHILARVVSIRLSVNINRNIRYSPGVKSVKCRQMYIGHWNPNTLVSLALIILLFISYSILPFVSSSSSSYPSEPFYDEVDNGTTDGFISHLSRSQLGYGASQATNPTEMSNNQNHFSESGEYNFQRTSSSQRIESQEHQTTSLPASTEADQKTWWQTKQCTIDGMFCVPANYSKYVPPLVPQGHPMNIAIGFDNFEILKIDDREFTVEINAYLIVKWIDKRILINIPDTQPSIVNQTSASSETEEWIPVELALVDRMWLPDTEILRLKGFHSLSVLGRLQGLWMNRVHEALFVLATRIKFMCPMNFAKFPMDAHTCKFQVGSFNYDNTKMRYSTYFLPKLPNSTDPILDYDVKITDLDWQERYYLPQETGNYSVAGFRMVMERKVSQYVITYYLPSGLFVVVSWASFLIPSDDIQGRMALLVTLFLVLINIFNAITTNSPKADGLNALQAWVLTCIFFVFGTLLEYSIILLHLKIYSVMQGIPENSTLMKLSQNVLPSGVLGGELPGNPNVSEQDDSSNQNDNGKGPSHRQSIRNRRFASFKNREDVSPRDATAKLIRKNQMIARLDIVCLIIFPIVFLLYAGIYLMTTLWL